MIRPEEITSVLLQELEGIEKVVEMTDIGYVIEVGDGVAAAMGYKVRWQASCFTFHKQVAPLGARILRHRFELGDGQRRHRLAWS